MRGPIHRRDFLSASIAVGAGALLPISAWANAAPRVLTASPGLAQLVPAQYPATPVWGYGLQGAEASIPGPEIRAVAGERVFLEVHNQLPVPTAVHWHGIRIVNSMDGASPLTQAPIQPDDRFVYDFVAPDPGTYWYHAHHNSLEQVSRGLSGPLIIEDPVPWLGMPGAADRELTWMLDDWLLTPEAEIVETRWDNLHDASHAGRMGNTLTVNGEAFPDISVRPGERLRLRLINSATGRVMRLGLDTLAMHTIALDGHPIKPRSQDALVLGPAQRADIVLDIPAQSPEAIPIWMDVGRGQRVEVARLIPTGAPTASTDLPVRRLPDWPKPVRLSAAQPGTQVELRMDGGAMRGIEQAQYRGRNLTGRELAQKGMVWALNGSVMQMTDPLFSFERGEVVELTLNNQTRWNHAIHLHGVHFEVVSDASQYNEAGDVRDTVMIAPEESLRVRFAADNPGMWMIHCHMLAHQKAGMMAWFLVS